MVERCQQVGISCTKWDSQQMGAMRAQIVIVTPESAVSKTFSTFLNELQGRRELVRIVFDECHTVMDSTPDFRPQMQQLGALSTREVQMVFLTAMLPKHTEPEFMRIMKIKPEEVQTIGGPRRGATLRIAFMSMPRRAMRRTPFASWSGRSWSSMRRPPRSLCTGEPSSGPRS
jgi:superfamily II DNA helicase RecQ